MDKPRPNWIRTLSRPLTLRDGRELLTLHDAREIFLSDVFAGVTHDVALHAAAELLITAANSGRPTDRREATDAVERVLRFRQLM